MPRKGTPEAGLALIAQRVFSGPAYTLIAYTNAADTLGTTSLLGDLVQPTQANGYAPILLDGTWNFDAGISTYSHAGRPSDDGFGNPCWIATGTWSAPVNGVAIIFSGVLQHFMDLVDAFGNAASFTAIAGAKLTISNADLTG